MEEQQKKDLINFAVDAKNKFEQLRSKYTKQKAELMLVLKKTELNLREKTDLQVRLNKLENEQRIQQLQQDNQKLNRDLAKVVKASEDAAQVYEGK